MGIIQAEETMKLTLLHNNTKNFYSKVHIPKDEKMVLMYVEEAKGGLFMRSYFKCFEKRFLSIQKYPDPYKIIKLKRL